MPVHSYHLRALLLPRCSRPHYRWYPRADKNFTCLLSAIVYSIAKRYHPLYVSLSRIFATSLRTVSAKLAWS
jgi:hypothetical protein